MKHSRWIFGITSKHFPNSQSIVFLRKDNIPIFNFIVIGAGIAGASIAQALHSRGLNVLVLEKDTICSGGSAAAGAFLSPKISKPSPYKNYLNNAFSYSMDFYARLYPDCLYADGLLKLPLDTQDILKCQSYEPYIDFDWEKKEDGYFFPRAGIVSAHKVVHRLLEGIEVIEHHPVTDIHYHDALWHIDDFTADALILATGHEVPPVSLPYLQTKNIGGYRYDVTYKECQKQSFNIHKDVSVSTFHENKIAIGATHIKEMVNLDEAAQTDRYGLVAKVKKIIPMPDLLRLQSYTGYRNFTMDYFPIVGAVVDHKKTQTTYPYIASGAKVPRNRYHYIPNLYIHQALGSRGYVFAPYNAKLLADLILGKKEIEARLTPAYRFQKWIRKQI